MTVFGRAKKDRGVARPAGGGGVVTKGPSKDSPEKADVIRMQNMLTFLSNQLGPNRDKVAELLGTTTAQVQDWERTLANTSMSKAGAAPSDGIWGPKTQAACKAAEALASVARAKTNSGTDIKPIVDGPTYKVVDSEVLKKNASANVDALISLLRALGLALPSGMEGKYAIYDHLPNDLNAQTVDPINDTKETNRLPLEATDVSSIFHFYAFVQNLYHGKETVASINKKYFEKLANNIRDSFIIKNAQAMPPTPSVKRVDPYGRQYAEMRDQNYDAKRQNANITMAPIGRASQNPQRGTPVAKTEPEPKSKEVEDKKKEVVRRGDQLTVAQFETALRWFVRRSALMVDTVNHRLRSGQKNPVTGEDTTDDDRNRAIKYYQDVKKLAQNWIQQRDRFIKTNQNPNETYIDPRYLDSLIGDRGLARPYNPQEERETGSGLRGGYGGVEIVPGETDDSYALNNPPLQDWMPDIRRLASEYGVHHPILNKMQIGGMDIGDWSAEAPQDLLPGYARQKMNRLQQLEWSLELVQAMQFILPQIYAKWAARVSPYLRNSEIKRKVSSSMRDQMNKLNSWKYTLGELEAKIRRFWVHSARAETKWTR